MKVAVTGASGVLGRAVTNHFHNQSIPTLPLSFSRTSPSVLYPNLPAPTPLDLLDDQAVRQFFTSLQSDPEKKIDFLIHCAAERRPDVAEADPERAAKLNEASTRLLAELAAELDFGLVYISTDYVFDGKKPPYSSGDAPNPLNLYGRLKRAGEEAVLDIRGKSSDQAKPLVVLRVPLLYGEVEYNGETAVNLFVDILEDQSGKKYTMDHFAVRFPTCVEDVARVIYDLTRLDKRVPAIVHYSSQKGLTKYEQLLIIASHTGASTSHVVPDAEDPASKPNPSGVVRPGNTQLSVEELKDLGVDVEETVSGGFDAWWKKWAGKKQGSSS